MSGQIQNLNDHRTIGRDTSLATGQIILNTQTIHYIIEKSLKTTIHLKFALFDSPEMGNLIIPVESAPFWGDHDQIPQKKDYKSWVPSRATFWNQLGNIHTHLKITRWWFQTFFIFIPTWGRFPFWLIFFRWVKATNQINRLHLKIVPQEKSSEPNLLGSTC